MQVPEAAAQAEGTAPAAAAAAARAGADSALACEGAEHEYQGLVDLLGDQTPRASFHLPG